jgi:hypothetical protein
MRRFAACVLLLAFGATASLSVARADPVPETPCVAFWLESRYVIGYDHIVHLDNQCLRDANCSVATNVNPTPQIVFVQAGQQLQVTTWRGSPSYQFAARVECTLASND